MARASAKRGLFGREGFLGRHDRVFLYVPNLIGYLRIALAFAAFSAARAAPGAAAALYLASFVCDELDGRAARALGQASTLGAVLDMVTDRCATACLLALLCAPYPAAQPALVGLLALDIASHWFQMYSTLAAGAATHKDVASRSRVVAFYYRHRVFMGFCCCSCEALYLAAYLLATPAWAAWAPVRLPGAAAAALRRHAPAAAARLGAGGSVPALAVFAAAMLPGFGVKQMVNVVQLRRAAEALARMDAPKRRRA